MQRMALALVCFLSGCCWPPPPFREQFICSTYETGYEVRGTLLNGATGLPIVQDVIKGRLISEDGSACGRVSSVHRNNRGTDKKGDFHLRFVIDRDCVCYPVGKPAPYKSRNLPSPTCLELMVTVKDAEQLVQVDLVQQASIGVSKEGFPVINILHPIQVHPFETVSIEVLTR